MKGFWRFGGGIYICVLAGCASVPDLNSTRYSLAELSRNSERVALIDMRAPVRIEESQRRMLLPESIFAPTVPDVLAAYLSGSLPEKLRGQPIELLEAVTEVRLIGGVGPSHGILAYDFGASSGSNIATNVAGRALANALLSRDRLIFDTSIRIRVGGNEIAGSGVGISGGWDREAKARESVEKALAALRERLQRS